jgi:Carboxypeptidase regulatory-like domain/TonB dependent receptor
MPFNVRKENTVRTRLFSTLPNGINRGSGRGRFLTALLLLAMSAPLFASDGGSLLGTVTDPHGAVVAGATVTVTEATTAVKQSVVTDNRGFYSFQNLAVGTYDVEIDAPGFKPMVHTGVVVNVASKSVVDASLTLGQANETVSVSAVAAHVETVDTQLGEVITEKQIVSVPLNGRSYTDLLALQSGVVPTTSLTSASLQDVGAAAFSPSGTLNPGTISVNGQRESANSFVLNGSDVEESVSNGTAVVPNLDSISEFRILTSNFDAEIGEFSGGQISVVTKGGGNAIHGDLFEFVRNTDLDARNYFSPTRGEFDQNQYGATLGGPVRKDKVFFFTDYQGTRLTQGVDTGRINVPSTQDLNGNLSDLGNSFQTVDTNGNPIPAFVTGTNCPTCWQNVLTQRLGYPVTAGENYYTPGCVSSNLSAPVHCVLPNAVIPKTAWSAPATNLVQYIPAPDNSDGTFSTSAFNQTVNDNKGGIRMDAATRFGTLSAYYFIDDWSQNNPYPVAQGGASVPGFNALNSGRAQLITVGDTKTISSSAVNEFHLSFSRDFTALGQPVGGLGVSLASQGFVTGAGTSGIVPLSPQTEGVESINFNNFSIGTNSNTLQQINNTYQVRDGFSKVTGTHTFKVGAELHAYQVNTHALAQFNGNFIFEGSETGSDFADFLLGIPTQYNQSQLHPFYGRNIYAGIYAQDSWRATKNLTLNYGLRWDRLEPWSEKYNQIATFAPGKQSVVFPGAPAGILFPTDPGVPATLGKPGNRDFAPRVGIAYAPSGDSSTFLGKLLGGPGKSSIRASWGMFYTAIEAETVGVSSGNAPYGTTYSSPAPPLLDQPFISAASGQNANGQSHGQYFPVTLAPLNSIASHPDTTLDWSQFEPIEGMPNFVTSNKIPFAEEYMLSLQRALGNNSVFTVSYVGAQAHHLMVLQESNPGNPALCLQLSNPANLAPGQTPCGPFLESNVYVTSPALGSQTINGTRGPQGPAFGSNTNMSSIGNSAYNSLQVTLKHTSGPLQMLAAYTYAKSLDDSSDIGEAVNPFNAGLSRAISSFDVRHNFVVSYTYRLPFAYAFHANNGWTKGWALSGITRLSSGLPVTLVNFGDNSLIGAEPNGINNFGIDEPDVAPGPLNLNSHPQNGRPFLNASLFSENALGTIGNAPRRYFYGPGLVNFNMGLQKLVALSESKSMQFRVEAFNVFNHAQFFGPEAVDGNIGDQQTCVNGECSGFGTIINAQPPRLIQVSAKFMF